MFVRGPTEGTAEDATEGTAEDATKGAAEGGELGAPEGVPEEETGDSGSGAPGILNSVDGDRHVLGTSRLLHCAE